MSDKSKLKKQLVELRNAVQTDAGGLILQAGKDFMVEAAAELNYSAEYIKGMGLLLDYLAKAEQRLDDFINNEKEGEFL